MVFLFSRTKHAWESSWFRTNTITTAIRAFTSRATDNIRVVLAWITYTQQCKLERLEILLTCTCKSKLVTFCWFRWRQTLLMAFESVSFTWHLWVSMLGFVFIFRCLRFVIFIPRSLRNLRFDSFLFIRYARFTTFCHVKRRV